MRVVVAMSGGVDSSVAAGLLVEQGHDVIGVHMKLHDLGGPQPALEAPGGPKRCCGLDDALDARRVADRLGIPFYVSNLKDAFRKAVMDDLAEGYLAGRTPNPCIQCNGVLKFRVLMGRALALGADALATGHYARVEGGRLLRAVDPDKDQSYFLFPISKGALERTLFPLGGMTKAEVRAHAERMGLVTAQKPESQEICFVPDDDHARFVREHTGVDGSGELVDEDGRVLGRHDGYYRYTVGQRRGLGLSLGRAAYVVAIDAATRRVVVGFEDKLLHSRVDVAQCSWLDRPSSDERVDVRIRHRGSLAPGRVGDGDAPRVDLESPVRAATPGQAAVFYRGDQVLGGGFITSAWNG